MNTDVVLGAEGIAADLDPAFRKTEALVRAYEQRLTRFSPDSELSALNRSAGQWFAASKDLFQVVGVSQRLVAETEGLFNPAILDALEQAGYDRSMDAIRQMGDLPAAPFAGRGAISVPSVRLDEVNQSICLPEGVRLDLGGIAKGWIAQQVAKSLSQFAPVCSVNAGGDLFAVGIPGDEGAWRIGLEDPRNRAHFLAVLRVGEGAVATSAVTGRTWRQGAKLQHHLIDPRTAQPADTDWLSVTVIAFEGAVAEAWAKALLIAGPDRAPQLANRAPIEFMAVDREGRIWGSPGARAFVEEEMGRA